MTWSREQPREHSRITPACPMSPVANGEDPGRQRALEHQPHLRDFRLPQRGLFGIADAFFEPYDPARHDLVASRRELPG